ncbi:EboA domain-containing protein [Lunatimonas salinarum]|uniref:EboA domain-containing protein n=1 Tax=Lunatimonas salinarum TaxID=1774590 RepID=UPI001AE05E0C|nr:EboA domain-containing protein [Lunatimonas salinarum]
MNTPLDHSRITAYLLENLQQQTPSGATEWLQAQAVKIAGADKASPLFIAFGQASRYFPKEAFALTPEAAASAKKLRKDWRPETWDQLKAARAYLVLHLNASDADWWMAQLSRLFETGDMYELEALYAALCILPHQGRLAQRASEGLRSNISTVFDAVALNNPFPSEQLNEMAWNQLVLKAIFLQRPLYQIIGSDSRNNANLADTLLDAVRERWSANRSVMPELWRYVGPFIDESNFYLIEKLFAQGSTLELQAGMLALTVSNYPPAQELMGRHPEIRRQIESGEVTWDSVGRQYVPFS